MKLLSHESLLLIIISACFVCCTDPPIVTEEYTECTIYRDKWGVPHIHGQTDRDVAYGLGWAGCEDDFNTLQEQMLAIKGMYGEVKGKDGIVADFAIQFMGIREYARTHMDMLDAPTLKLIRGYVSGVNAYAMAHPEEVLLDAAFPVLPYDIVAGYLLGLVEISSAGADLARLADGSIVEDLAAGDTRGSNALAVSASKTEEGQTFLAVNSHQPMQGWYSWYEVHLVSDEGLNILGGTFPGAATIFHGTNEHLGWAHTVNHSDFSDVYRLKMHPEKEDFYEYEGRWMPLVKKQLRAWVKLFGPIKIPITRMIYKSKYGMTFKVGEEYFSWRFQAGEAVRAVEQWYKMNRATNFGEWRAALDIKGLPCTNIVYADDRDNIYYVSNGRHPRKDPSIDWSGIIEGGSANANWGEDWPIDSLPQVLNPNTGFVFNTNNTPYSSAGEGDDPVPLGVQQTMGYEAPNEENNRSLRFQELMDTVTRLSYEDFLDIKYDRTYPAVLRSHPYAEEDLLRQDPDGHPEYREAIQLLAAWDRSTSADNTTAALFLLSKEALVQTYRENGQVVTGDYMAAIASAHDELMDSYGRLEIALGDFQRHRRGEVDLPLGGGADVLGAIYSGKDDDGKYVAYSGESYIQVVRFDSINGPIIETINAYGSSARPESPHYTDQMSLFVDQELKPMTLDMDKVKQEAVRQYHPLKIKH